MGFGDMVFFNYSNLFLSDLYTLTLPPTPSLHAVRVHLHVVALLQPTCFTSLPVVLGNLTIMGPLPAWVLLVLGDGPPEEKFAALTGEDIIVSASAPVSAHLTHLSDLANLHLVTGQLLVILLVAVWLAVGNNVEG